MIKWIVSDLDGTLFEGHGETVFDLSPANEAALQAVQNAGIEFSAASGRMIGYGIHLLEKYGFPQIRTAGFNGAVCYDQGQFVVTHALARSRFYKKDARPAPIFHCVSAMCCVKKAAAGMFF